MKTIEIYWQDISEDKQKEILEALGDNGNYDVFPIASIEYDETLSKQSDMEISM